jgi:2-polyprenyl-6-methoxyphenol hydroxylase-like FAD-dependent oxidoreductase
LLLHRDGHRVTVFERFATPQPIGSGLMLQPTGLAVLGALGLADKVLARGRRIDRMFGRVLPSRRTVLDLHYRSLAPDAFGLAVHRATLFEPLFDAVQRSAIAIETGRTVTAISDDDGRLLFDNGTQAGPFDLVIDALGMRSPLGGGRSDLAYGALWTTLPWPRGRFDDHALEQRYERASVMIGVLPIGRRSENGPDETAFFWSLKPADYDAWRAGGLDAWKARVRNLWPETDVLLDCIESPDQMTLARYAHHTTTRPFRKRFVSIGDSAHAASPQLGQGGNMALLDAYALALALRSSGEMADALKTYAGLRRSHIRFYQVMSAMFTPFYQSDSRVLPWLRDWFVAPATGLPVVRGFTAAMVAGTIFDPRRTLGIGARER